MSTLANIQHLFSKQTVINNSTPDLALWVDAIRAIHPKGALYVIIHDYVEIDGSGSQHDAYLLKPSEINWPGKSNEPIFRSTYFHKSNHDSNIWVLKTEYRGHSNTLKALVMDASLIA